MITKIGSKETEFESRKQNDVRIGVGKKLFNAIARKDIHDLGKE